MRHLLIRGALVTTAAEVYCADVRVTDGVIAEIGQRLPEGDARVVEAAGKYLLPGGVDVHTHFDLPMFGTVSSDDHYTGHKAAAFGGTTTVIDFASHEFASLKQSVEAWHARVGGKAAIDYSFHMNITRLDPDTLEQIARLPDEGITSVKVFSAYNGRLRLDDAQIFQVLRAAGKAGLLTMLHAENGDLIDLLVAEALAGGHTSPAWHGRTRPAWSAVEATLRGAALAAQAGAPLYVVHMNAGGEVDMLRYARGKGAPVMGETCPQYLFFSDADLARPDGAKWVCSPPVRTPADQLDLWRGLADGTLQVVATDHCPFYFDGGKPILYEGKPVAIAGKELGRDDFTKIPNGLPGVGDRLPVMWTHGARQIGMTPSQFVALHCATPAKIFGLYPRKGAIIPGADADLVIWDPEKEVRYGTALAQHRTDYNLYEGWQLRGFPEQVFLRGELIVDHGEWLGRPGGGRFLHRSAGELV